eukprot:Protomagalhaensia_wolfi_Nauph_80__420@NODE_1230_length_1645_cov_43_645704_g800_i1_p1_GENE_NODE_1230_length_1645_cov_43_645704_g800_i1NODE_1230_length_1645_cov_43_645704_g800_i1_p1_ORF_typecomplete_len195_score21_44TPR_16/PF13432_6/0_00039TPR_16/PF13432_6/0_00019TPR_16/PF13432_6/5_5e02TPR_16/PF13432_6/12TPR_16/PF13432_6/2_5e02TPR_11/PF13414_6/0_00087TPR_11/PF13414_6/0_24TPR_11/PF13414_6/20TPR_11/PF13414_6/0_46TPR_11/PF13414_6/2_5TPR_19/PF14559_6/0_011TPR_19/PF14559_6/0_0068TPR_19/PF14559_6/1_9e03
MSFREQYENRALDYLEKRQFRQAIQEFSDAISRDPSKPSYWIGRCRAHAKMMASLSPDLQPMYTQTKGINDAEEALKLDPENGWAWFWKGRCCTKDPHEAYAKAVFWQPDCALFWAYKGSAQQQYYGSQLLLEWSAGFKDILRALDLDPTLAIAWYFKGKKHENSCQGLTLMQKCYQEAYRLKPTNAEYKRLAS